MKKIIIFIICILFFILAFIMFKNNKFEKEGNLSLKNLPEEKIQEISEDLGYNNINTDLYEINQEYDGREVVVVKPNVQYKVAMAGVVKNGKPEFSEIDSLLEDAPNQNGIWVEKKSRDAFLDILEEITNGNYSFDSNGFLIEEQNQNFNELDKKIENAINSKKLYALSINSIAYLIDEVTGNIEEYPFEEIDPELPFECFETENAALYVITPNTYKKLNYKYVIEEIFK